MMNKCLMIGNLVRDPEFTVSPRGVGLCRFSIAVNERRGKGEDAEEKVNYFDWKAFGKVAEVIEKYFSKGKPIAVSGRVNQQRWEDRESGQKRSRVEFILEEFDFVGGGAREEREPSSAASEKPKAGADDALNAPLDPDEEPPF